MTFPSFPRLMIECGILRLFCFTRCINSCDFHSLLYRLSFAPYPPLSPGLSANTHDMAPTTTRRHNFSGAWGSCESHSRGHQGGPQHSRQAQVRANASTDQLKRSYEFLIDTAFLHRNETRVPTCKFNQHGWECVWRACHLVTFSKSVQPMPGCVT